jgi:hypothetical protein
MKLFLALTYARVFLHLHWFDISPLIHVRANSGMVCSLFLCIWIDLCFNFSSCQILGTPTTHVLRSGLACEASADSIWDYGQYLILSTGNFLGSAATANSTMDFSPKPVEDGVVDSPPSGRKRQPLSCSPSPLRPMGHPTSVTPSDKVPQRKLYEDLGCQVAPVVLKSKVPSTTQHSLPNIVP